MYIVVLNVLIQYRCAALVILSKKDLNFQKGKVFCNISVDTGSTQSNVVLFFLPGWMTHASI